MNSPQAHFAIRPVWSIGWRYLLRHAWQSILMILGICLGAAVVVAIDLANASASRAFDLSTDAVVGKATHQISAGPGGLDEKVYVDLRLAGIPGEAAPVISEYVSSAQLGGGLLQLVGIDPFVDAPFRSYLGAPPDNGERQPLDRLSILLTQPGSVLISADLAERHNLRACILSSQGCPASLEIGGNLVPVRIQGLLSATDATSRRAVENLVVADIATAQELTGRTGKIDRIDMILPGENLAQVETWITQRLPENARLTRVEARSGTIEEMTAAFRVNLTALSLLALVVGMFLIYNTMTFSVIQRRPLFGTLRCLGATRAEVFTLVASEALMIGLIGAVLGCALGVVLGQAAVRMVTQTINDLFFVLTVRGVQIPVSSLLKGGALGILATVLTALPPAWEAASVPPRSALSRSGLESKARRAVWLAAAAGIVLVLLGAGAFLLPSRDLVTSFSGTFAVIIGFAMLAPLATNLLMRSAAPMLGSLWGSLGRMAPRNVNNSLSRTSIAVAALMVAVSVTIGVSLMVDSFRYTVQIWLEQTLQGDVYLSAPSLTSTRSSAPVDPQVLTELSRTPGVAQVFFLRSANVDSPLGETHIAATSDPQFSLHRSFLATSVPVEQISDEMRRGAVIISEPYANRVGITQPGLPLRLYTDDGPQDFTVAGIYADYASTQGTVLMALDVYRKFWQDPAITAAALMLDPGEDPDRMAARLRTELSDSQRLVIRANRALREEVMQVFDRTFAITGALQLLATLVAFIGMLSALLSVELERQREMGILRAVGLTVRQLWGLVLLETGLIGSVSGFLAMPTGYVLALILVFIINRRSFGWTLQMQVTAEPFLIALIVAVSAALLAGIYPARRMGKMLTARAIRYE
jgi:putative ABC transport system permease protein